MKPQEANPGILSVGDTGRSETAATVGNELYKPSGAMLYRVQLGTPMGLVSLDVMADGGDDAAAKALAKHPGCKVATVNPAPAGKKVAEAA